MWFEKYYLFCWKWIFLPSSDIYCVKLCQEVLFSFLSWEVFNKQKENSTEDFLIFLKIKKDSSLLLIPISFFLSLIPFSLFRLAISWNFPQLVCFWKLYLKHHCYPLFFFPQCIICMYTLRPLLFSRLMLCCIVLGTPDPF